MPVWKKTPYFELKLVWIWRIWPETCLIFVWKSSEYCLNLWMNVIWNMPNTCLRTFRRYSDAFQTYFILKFRTFSVPFQAFLEIKFQNFFRHFSDTFQSTWFWSEICLKNAWRFLDNIQTLFRSISGTFQAQFSHIFE